MTFPYSVWTGNEASCRPTGVHSGEDALHRVEGAVAARARLSRLVAVGTQVKVITYKALVPFSRKATFTTSITADP